MLRFFLYKIGQWIAVSLPLKYVYKLAVFLADLHRLISRTDRTIVADNLKVIFPSRDKKVIKVHQRDVFRNFAKYLVDFLRFGLIDKNYVSDNIAIEGLDIVDAALDKGKGVIATTVHMANWELSGVAMALLGYPVACVVLKHRNPHTDRFFTYQRENKGMKVIPLANAAFRCLQALKKNKLLALVGDTDFTQAGIMMDFLGKSTIIPKGPAALSLKTGAALLVGIMLRENNDKFRFIWEGPVEINPSGDEENDIIMITKRYIAIFEKYIKKYPGQWLMFRRFWEPVGIDACD